MALNTAPSFGNSQQVAAQPLANRIAKQRPMNSQPMGPQPRPMGMGGNVPMSGGNVRTGKAGGGFGGGVGAAMDPRTGTMQVASPTPRRVQGDPLMSAPPMDGGMIAQNAPPMGPPPMFPGMGGGAKSPMMPPMGGGGMEGPQDMSSVFSNYPRRPDPRFRY